MSRSKDIDYAGVPHVPFEALRLLWICDFHDVTLSGMLLYQGKIHWYQICDDIPDTTKHRYTIHELNDGEAAHEEKWRPLFAQHVGDHFAPDNAKPASEHTKFYEPYGQRTRPDYSTRPIVGWFEM